MNTLNHAKNELSNRLTEYNRIKQQIKTLKLELKLQRELVKASGNHVNRLQAAYKRR